MIDEPKLLCCPFCGSTARTIYDMDDKPKWAQCINHGRKKKTDVRCYLSHQMVPIVEWNYRHGGAA